MAAIETPGGREVVGFLANHKDMLQFIDVERFLIGHLINWPKNALAHRTQKACPRA
jgi:hypothetical protein